MTHEEAITAAAKAACDYASGPDVTDPATPWGELSNHERAEWEAEARAAIAAFLAHVEATDAVAAAAQATSGGQPFTWANACRAMLAQIAREIAPG